MVTGVAGFIGSHVAEALIRAGRRVVGVDNFDPFYDEAVKRRNLADVARAAAASPFGAEGFELVRADIRHADAMREVFGTRRPATVFHLAARAGVRPSIAQPALYAAVNVEGSINVLEAARHAGCSRIVLASSSSVYGNASRVPFREDDGALAPISPYAATKLACELLAHTWRSLHGTRIACLRFFTAYGPRQRPDLAIQKFMTLLSRGQPLPIFGDGSMSRDFTYIDDIVSGVLAAERAIDAHGLRVWNLGGSSPVSVLELVSAIAQASGLSPTIDHRPVQPGDVERTYADLSRSRAELGFAPRTSLAEGLARQWAWVRSMRETRLAPGEPATIPGAVAGA